MVLVLYKLIKDYRTVKTNNARFLGLQLSDDFSTLVCVTSFPLRGEPHDHGGTLSQRCSTRSMRQMRTIPKHPEAHLWPQ